MQRLLSSALLLAWVWAVPSIGQDSGPADSDAQFAQNRRSTPRISRETTDYDVERLLEQNDQNKDGKIGKGDGELRGMLSRSFGDFDTNSDGYLDKAELKRTNIRPYSGKMFLDAYDDGDGVLTKAEATHRALVRDFEKLDTDNSGTLSQAEMDEMRGGMRFRQRRPGAPGGRGGFGGGFLGGRRNPVEAAMESDANEDGKLSKKEATGLVKELFDSLDTNKDEMASRAELQANTRLLTFGRFAGLMLQRTDTDGDGKVSKEEALNLPDRNPLRGRFDESDADKDGYVSKLEYIQEFARRGAGAIGGRMNPVMEAMESDANEDGKLSKEEANALVKELFDTFDTDDDGAVSEAELRANTRLLSIGRFADRILQNADTNGDGKIAKDEAVELPNRNFLRSRFDEFDADKDGFLTRAEYIQGMAQRTRNGGPGNFAAFMLQRGDSDGDGKMSEEEFGTLPGTIAPRIGTFEDLDTNHDGYLESDEFGPALDRIRNSSPARRFARDDSDEDGYVTKDEATQTIKEYFDTLDSDGDGRVSRAEHRERNALVQLRLNEKRLGRRLIGVQIELSDDPGLRVVRVTNGGLASEAGINADDHILSINGDSVEDAESLRDAVNSGASKLQIRIIRNGEEHEVEIEFD